MNAPMPAPTHSGDFNAPSGNKCHYKLWIMPEKAAASTEWDEDATFEDGVCLAEHLAGVIRESLPHVKDVMAVACDEGAARSMVTPGYAERN